MNLTSLDVRYAVEELSRLEEGKIEKITQSSDEKRDILISIYKRDMPKIHLRFILPGMMCVHREKPDYQKMPPGFAMFLRKYIQGAKISSVRQRGFDRMLDIECTSGRGTFTLVAELIPPGNLILLEGDKIKGLLENQAYKDRNLRGGIVYEPPSPAFDPAKDDILKELKESDRDSIVTTLAMSIGLGGVYAEEICVRTGIDKSRNDLSDAELKSVAKTIGEMLESKLEPHADDKRAYPFKMESVKAKPVKGMFLNAVSRFAKRPEKKTKKDKRKDKLENMRKAQKKNIKVQKKKAEEYRNAGERIYEEYQVIQEILQAADEARDTDKDIGEALKRFPQVKKYNKKTQEIEVEL